MTQRGVGRGAPANRQPSRRLMLKVLGALPAAASLSPAWLVPACSSSGPRYLDDTERRVLGACADAIFPPDDSGPGGAELGAVDFIDALLTAFEHDPPRIHAAGPFSDRNPFPSADGTPSSRYSPDQFLDYLPLSRVQRAGWQLRIYGSRGVPGGGPNDAVLGPVIGLRDLLRDSVKAAITAFGQPIDGTSDVALRAIYDYVPDDARAQIQVLVLQSLFSLPEYGGNRDRGAWRIIHFDGDSMPLGYTYVEPGTQQIRDRPGAPVIGPETAPDPDPMDEEILDLFRAAVAVLGGKTFY